MAFGRIRRKRRKQEEEQRRREAQIQEQIRQSQDPTKIAEEYQGFEEQYRESEEANKPYEEGKREEFKEQSYQDVTTDIPGMSEDQKRAMKESANAQIDSQIQNYQRTLASQSGMSGVRGGAAAAPQISLAKQGLQAQNQFQRDLIEKDADVAMQKLAAYMASLEGKTAADLLKKQQYIDYITGKQAQNKQDVYSKYYGKDYRNV